MNYIVNIFTANSDTSKLTGKIQLAWWFYPITIFTLTVGNNKWLKIKWTFIWHWSFSQRTNNSEEMDFNTKPELRVRTHLRSLFINLRPVWLQSDDSVELVQGQVSILYVLAGWQESGGEGVGGSRTITFTFTATVTKGKRKKRPFDHISFVEGRQGEGCQVKSALIELHNDSLSLTVGQTEHSHCSGEKKNTWSQRELV